MTKWIVCKVVFHRNLTVVLYEVHFLHRVQEMSLWHRFNYKCGGLSVEEHLKDCRSSVTTKMEKESTENQRLWLGFCERHPNQPWFKFRNILNKWDPGNWPGVWPVPNEDKYNVICRNFELWNKTHKQRGIVIWTHCKEQLMVGEANIISLPIM